MTAYTQLKTLLVGVATVAVVSTAFAQGTPPTTATPNAATGAGQQSSQNTPMGTTGTAGGGTMAQGGAAGTGSTTGTGSGTGAGTSGSTGSNMGASGSTDTTTSGTNRPMRADRN